MSTAIDRKMKPKPKLNPENYDPIRHDDFTESVRSVLLRSMKPTLSENREPTKEELNKRWKLERRK